VLAVAPLRHAFPKPPCAPLAATALPSQHGPLMKMLVFSEWLLWARIWLPAPNVCARSCGARCAVRRNALNAIMLPAPAAHSSLLQALFQPDHRCRQARTTALHHLTLSGSPSLNAGLGLSTAVRGTLARGGTRSLSVSIHHPCICDRSQDIAVYQQRIRGAGCSAQSVCGHESGHARPWRQHRPGSQLARPGAKGRRCACGRQCCLTSLKSLECVQRCTCTSPYAAAAPCLVTGRPYVQCCNNSTLEQATCRKHCAVTA